jgi:ribosomal protein S19
MQRSCWKVPFVSRFFFSSKFQKLRALNTRIRNATITGIFIDKTLRVYNGAKLKSFYVRGDMCGKKTGEFSITKVLGEDILYSKARKLKAKKKKK